MRGHRPARQRHLIKISATTRREVAGLRGRISGLDGSHGQSAIQVRPGRYTRFMSIATRRKTSFAIDTAKVAAAQEVLGTKGLTDTVDAALTEVVKVKQRRKLLELLSTPGALELDNPEIMVSAWR